MSESNRKSGRLWIAVVAAATLGLGGQANASIGAGILNVRIENVLAGANGDSRVQFVELLMEDANQALWGPQDLETESRTILTFHDATGLEVGRYAFTTDAPVGVADANGNFSVLVATAEFVNVAGGIVADFTMPVSLVAVNGMVCFRRNPQNGNGDAINVCLSYGNYAGGVLPNAPGVEEDGCAPNRDNGLPLFELPIASDVDVVGLVRNANDGSNQSFGCYELGGGNADFALAPAIARNSAGDLSSVAFAAIEDQGRTLFENETFYGNGRTCSTCHVEAFSFGLPPSHIADRFASFDPMDPDSDKLFVNESDDQAAELADLENICLMRQGNQRGLSLENVNGFDMDPGFRATPHLLNIGLSAPYGLSGDLEELEGFAVGAVGQHLTRTLARNTDPTVGPLDFRILTVFEEIAVAAFQIEASVFPPLSSGIDIGTVPNALFTTTDRDNFLDAMIARYMIMFPSENPANIAAGRALYFGETTGQCFRCHDGQALGTADGSLGPDNAFDIVRASGFPANADDGCSGGIGDPGPPLPPADAGRAFNNAPLIGIARTAPFFHDNNAETLRDAVDHYTRGRFRDSPAGLLLPQDIDLEAADIDRIVDFLNAVSFVPEPSSVWLQVSAVAVLAGLRRRRQ